MRTTLALTAAMLLAHPGLGEAAGTLTSVGSAHAPIQIRDHHVNVVIDNGFAQTEVVQTFHNPNDVDLEAIYSFPLPKSASLSEVTVTVGEHEIEGEVVAKHEARKAYEDERDAGRDAGLAEKDGYQTFDFAVSPVKANGETRVRFLYYQPLVIDTGIGRYLYPLEDGGTDEVTPSFWTANRKVEGTLSMSVELKSAWPVVDVRVPGLENSAMVSKVDEGRWLVELTSEGASLDRDFVLYYRLADDLPGRVEVVPYRAAGDGPGTFMLVATPGLDLGPLTDGADYTFVLDVSGSMSSKLGSLAEAVRRTLGLMRPEDRFRVVTFSDTARDLTGGFVSADPRAVEEAIRAVESLRSGGSTNLFDGLSMGLTGLDDDRVSSLVLVTDGVTNTGVVDPRKFAELMKSNDVRVFGFLMGNSANWPLMRLVCETSGGFYAGVSNADDIVGQVLLAKGKVTHEALHEARLAIDGVRVSDTSGEFVGKVYHGQQLVMFGRYARGGKATLTLKARLSGEDKVYRTTVELPDVDGENPEIERLWALDQVERIETRDLAGELDHEEASAAIRDLGVAYQIVTDETSMLVLSDEAFAARGIERRNRERTTRERAARTTRAAAPARQRRADTERPMFGHRAPSLGGGALDPLSGALALGLGALGLLGRRRRRR